MTAKTTSPRSDVVRKRRTTQNDQPTRPAVTPAAHKRTTPKAAFQAQTVYLPGDLHRMAPRTTAVPAGKKQTQGTVSGRMGVLRKRPSRSARNERNGFDLAFSLGRADVRTPVLTLPRMGPRWVSGILTLLLGFMLYTMWTASTFSVSAAEVTGNERLTPQDVYNGLGVAGQPIFKAVPALIEKNLRTAYPDLASVKVEVGFPNRVAVQVVERMPLLLWYQDGKTTWIDANGIAFMPRGSVDGLVQVSASGSPTGILQDPKKSLFDQVFIQPEMVKAIIALAP